MPITFHPNPGNVLMCDFNTGFHPPEMVKVRPVVVVSGRKRRGSEVVSIVPLSTTRPRPVEVWHHRIDTSVLPGKLCEHETWAKCDMITTVALWRLDRIKVKTCGKRTYHTGKLHPADFQSIQKCIMLALGLPCGL